jgi:hypothetical protein
VTTAAAHGEHLGQAAGGAAPQEIVDRIGVDHDTHDTAAREGRLSDLPTNHSPQFVPALHPTLRTGVETLVAAAGAWAGPRLRPARL